jgi:Protein of unknown function (DUF2442)
MSTLVSNVTSEVSAKKILFEGDILVILLSDGREIKVPTDKVTWLAWLYKASAEQREQWSLEPGGYAVYWESLDDGFEINHLLSVEPLV